MLDMAVNQDGMLRLLDETDQKHAEAHKRLREDVNKLDQRLEDGLQLLHEAFTAQRAKVTELANTPLDVTKLVLTPRIVATIVAVLLSVFGGMWATTAGLRSDLRNIDTLITQERRVTDERAKLLDLNSVSINRVMDANARELKESIAEIKRRQDMLTLQYNELNDKITRLTAQRGR